MESIKQKEVEVSQDLSRTKQLVANLKGKVRQIAERLNQERLRQENTNKNISDMINRIKLRKIKKKTLYLEIKQNTGFLHEKKKEFAHLRAQKRKTEKYKENFLKLKKEILRLQTKLIKAYEELESI